MNKKKQKEEKLDAVVGGDVSYIQNDNDLGSKVNVKKPNNLDDALDRYVNKPNNLDDAAMSKNNIEEDQQFHLMGLNNLS